MFVFVSFLVLLSVCGVPAHIDEIKVGIFFNLSGRITTFWPLPNKFYFVKMRFIAELFLLISP